MGWRLLRWTSGLVLVGGLVGLAFSNLAAQVGGRGDLVRQEQELIEEFVNRAVRLAAQYEAAGDYDRAKRILRAALQIKPEDERARQRLDRIEERELSQNRVVVRVHANRGWQDTGIVVYEGRPVAFAARGEWILRMTQRVGPDGMKIPDDWKELPLGALIGVIEPLSENAPRRGKSKKAAPKVAVRPFFVGENRVYTPPYTGRLYLKMHDADESDNAGFIVVQVSGYVTSSP